MQFLKANTQVIVTVGPFVDITDGLTPETGITLGAADEAELVKHGSTSVVDIAAATWAAVTSADGYYSLTLTTSHTDTEGMLVVIVQDDSVCLPVKAEYMVLAQAAYDSMFGAKDSGYMDVNVKAVSEDTTAADNLELACDNYSATRGLSGTALPAVAADAAGGLPISDAGALDLDTLNTNVSAILTDTGTTLDGKIDTIDGIVDAILVDTGTDIPASLTTIDNFLDTEIAAILEDTGTTLPATLATIDGKVDTIDGIVDAILVDTGTTLQGELDGIQADTEDLQTQIGAAGAGLSAIPWNAAWDAEVESEVDDALGGGTGTALSAIPWNASWDAEVQSEVDDALVAQNLDHLVKIAVDTNFETTVHLDSVIGHLADNGTAASFDRTTDSLEILAGGASAASIADAVWEEAIADHSGTAGSTAEALNAAGAAGDPWVTAIPGAYGAGSAGYIIGTNLDANIAGVETKIDTIDGIVDSILVDTGTDIPASITTIDNFLDTEIAAILEDTGTTLPATLTTIEGKIDTVDGVADAILVDTGTTLDAALAVVDANVDAILVDTGTTLDAALAVVDANVDAILVDTGTTLDTIVDSILEDTGTTLPATLAALNNISAADVNAQVVDVLRTDTLPDSYSTDGAQPTIAQAVLAILQFLTEKAVSGTTVTVNKPDGSTAAMTFTLDSATDPTSITRAT